MAGTVQFVTVSDIVLAVPDQFSLKMVIDPLPLEFTFDAVTIPTCPGYVPMSVEKSLSTEKLITFPT
jgi:hypothetical protein